ncbi:hypothetical protein TFLX_05343 [Thermoflexales bacterium]|nr:hypothetical protein TFLX_05343 [Thermoflexales bacterium]
MTRRRVYYVLLSWCVVSSILLSSVSEALAWDPPATHSQPQTSVSNPPDHPLTSQTASLPALSLMQTAGHLRLAPAIDLDGDPATNPTADVPVPVIDLVGQLGGIVTLAAQVETRADRRALPKVPVTFRLWNERGDILYERTIPSDEWGAASVELPVVDLASGYAYAASAPGYGQTETRRFHFDPARVSYRAHVDGTQLWYWRAGPGRVQLTLRSPVPLNAERDQAVLTVIRSAPESSADPERKTSEPSASQEPLRFPELTMRIVGAYTATLDVQLPTGDYAFLGRLTVNGTTTEQFLSQAIRLQIEGQSGAQTAKAISSSAVGAAAPEYSLVQYQAPEGRAIFDLLKSDQVPPLSDEWTDQREFVKSWRTGPFEWREEHYAIEVETHVTDGKKAVALKDFDYDPLARRYTIAIKSLQAQPISDVLRIDVLGPGGAILRHQDLPIVLEPDRVFEYTVEVPAELGQPEGLRVTLDDPLIEDIKSIIAAVQRLYSILSTKGKAEWKLNGFIRAYIELLTVKLVEVKYDFPPYDHWPEVKSDFLEELLSDPWSLLLRLGAGALDGVQLFRINWWEVLKALWRRQLTLDQLLDKIIAALSVDLGGAGLDVGVEAGFKVTVDVSKCPDPEALENLKQRLSDLALRLKQHMEVLDKFFPIGNTVQLYPPLGLKLAGVQLNINGDVDFTPWTMTMVGQGSVGFTARVGLYFDFSILRFLKDLFGNFDLKDPTVQRRLKIVGWFAIAEAITKYAKAIVKWVDIINIIYDIVGIRIPEGDCDPDPPDPRPPDDRQDVWQGIERFYQGQTADATIDNLTSLIQRAQALGLVRAERLLTWRLRQAELGQFTTDADHYVSYVEDSLDTLLSAQLEIADILTGTIPITDELVLTQTIEARLTQAWADVGALPYAVEQQQILDSVNAAQLEYDDLRGEELELYNELRQLFTTDAVGVVASGFAEATISALESAGLPWQLVSPWPGDGAFRGRPAPYFAPELAPHTLIMPSGGLHLVANSPTAQAWLDQYVATGGLLIVFTQAFGDDWRALPGGEVSGVGYEEDQRWQHATVKAEIPSDWLVWMGIEKPDIQVDGAFTTWPANANLLLRRTFGRYAGSPIMIEYAHGAGTVLATTAYGDWAWQAGYWWGDDWQMTRSLLIRGYLLSHDQDVGDVFAADPATTVNVSFPFTNTGTFTTTRVDVVLPVRLGYWGQDYRAVIPVTVPPGQTTTINASLQTPPVMRGVHDWTQIGLYRLQVTAHTSDNRQATTAGPVVYVRSPVIPPPVAVNLQPERTQASFLQSVPVTATVRNYTALTQTVIISGQQNLPAMPVVLTVPPLGQSAHVYTVIVTGSLNLAIIASNELGRLYGTQRAAINVAYPSLWGQPLVPTIIANGSIISLPVTNRQSALGSALVGSVRLTLTAPSGVPVWTTWQLLPPLDPGQTVTPTYALSLPSSMEQGVYQLVYRIDDGRGLSREASVPLPAQLTTRVEFDRFAYRIREALAFTVSISNTGRFDLEPLLLVFAPDAGFSDSQALVLPAGGPGWSGAYNFTVPDSLASGSYPVQVALQLANTITRTPTFFVLPAQVTPQIDRGPHIAGQTLPVTLTNVGGVDATLTYTLALRDFAGHELLLGQDLSGTLVAANQAVVVSGSLPITLASGSYVTVFRGRYNPGDRPIEITPLVQVSGSDVQATADSGPFTAGGPLPILLTNHGSVDALVTYDLLLSDRESDLFLGSDVTGTLVPAQTSVVISGTVPAGTRSGFYALHVTGVYTPGARPVNLTQAVQIDGPLIELTARTDRPQYLTTDDITTTAHVTNTGTPLPQGELDLAIVRDAVSDPLLDVFDMDNSGISSNYVTAVDTDADGNTWLASTGGYYGTVNLDRLLPDLTTWDSISLPESPSFFAIHRLDHDDTGRIWLATDNGVAVLSADHSSWTTYQTFDSGLVSDWVSTVAIDGAGNAWLGTNSGVNRLSTAGEWITYTTGNSGLTSDYVYAIADDAHGNLWIGTDNGLNQLTPGGTWITYTLDNSGLLSEAVYDIDFDQAGNVWLATPQTTFPSVRSNRPAAEEGGVSALLTSGEWITYTWDNSNLLSPETTAIAVDNYGRKWIGYEFDGLSVLSKDNTHWEHFWPSDLSGYIVNDLDLAPDSAMWVATEGGGEVGTLAPGDGGDGGATRSVYVPGEAEVLWTRAVTTSLGSPDTFVDVATLAAADLNATGRLALRSVFTSLTTDQVLAQDYSPFYVFSTTVALTLDTDRVVYKPGEVLTAFGALTNTSPLTLSNQWLIVNVNGAPAYSAGPFDLSAGQAQTFVVTATLPDTVGSVAVEAVSPLIEVNRLVSLVAPSGEAVLSVPAVAGPEPFRATVVITNASPTDAIVQVNLADTEPVWLALEPDQFGQVERMLTITDDAIITATVRGDLEFDLAQAVTWGEGAAFALLPTDSTYSGDVLVTYLVTGTGALPTPVELRYQLDSGPVLTQTLTVQPDQVFINDLLLQIPAGQHQLTARLYDQAQRLLDQDELLLSLSEPGTPSLPNVRLLDVTTSPAPASAGQPLSVTLLLANEGSAGPLILGVQLFDPLQQWIITPSAWLTQTISVLLEVPPDLPSDSYFGEVIVDGEVQPFTVDVQGIGVELALALDQPTYLTGQVANLQVTLTDTMGATNSYILMARYLSAESYVTLTVPASQTVQYTFPFTATDSGRANVFLSNLPSPQYGQRVITLDSLPVLVADPADGAYLTFDRQIYNPGETVQMLAQVTGTLHSLLLMGPLELVSRDPNFVVWEPPIDADGLSLITSGAYPLSYTLPAELREGRYTFSLQVDGETILYPIDVRGWKVTTRHARLAKQHYRQQDELSATVEFWNEHDEPIDNLRLSAWVYTPDDGAVLAFAPLVSRTIDLQPGLNVFTMTGAFTTPVVGSHRLLINLSADGWRVAGASAQFDVGAAHLIELDTDHGTYAPGVSGIGRLQVYGYGPTQLVVTATNGSTLLNVNPTLSGFATLTFTVPTTPTGNHALQARSVDQNGAVDRLVRAYAVPAPIDRQPPSLQVTYPNTYTLIHSAAPSLSLDVIGQAADAEGDVTVLVNGQSVTPTLDGAFSMPLTMVQGLNLVSVAALDSAGNITYAPLVPVYVVPDYGLALSVARTSLRVGEQVTFQAVVTTTGVLSPVVVSQDFAPGVISDLTASASQGQVEVITSAANGQGLGLNWLGPISSTQPATVTIRATVSSTGTLTESVMAAWGWGLSSESNPVQVVVLPALSQIYLPIIRR